MVPRSHGLLEVLTEVVDALDGQVWMEECLLQGGRHLVEKSNTTEDIRSITDETASWKSSASQGIPN